MPSWKISKSGAPVETAEFVAREIRNNVRDVSKDEDGWEGSNAVTVAHDAEDMIRSVGRNLQNRFRVLADADWHTRRAEAEQKALREGKPFEEPPLPATTPVVLVECGGRIEAEQAELTLRVRLANEVPTVE